MLLGIIYAPAARLLGERCERLAASALSLR